MNPVQFIDEAVIMFIYENIQCQALDGIMSAITRIGDKGAIWIALTLILLIASVKKKSLRTMALSCTLALIFSLIFCNLIIKPLVMRPRPYDVLGLQIIIERLSDYSFPSGHTSAAFAFAVSVWLNNRRSGIAAITLAVLIAVTRLYLCVHFPTDVLAGAVLGILCAIASVYIIKKLSDLKKDKAVS